MSGLSITADDRHCAEEFKANPFGPHGPRLTEIVTAFRSAPVKGKYVLFDVIAHREWALGRLTGEPAQPLEVFEACRFSSLGQAEWEVFKLRWKAAGGPDLPGEPVVKPGTAVAARSPLSLTGYADRLSARPGETIRFMVSSEEGAGYDAEIVRLICGDTNPDGPGYREEAVQSSVFGHYEGRKQVIHAGSYVVVGGAPALESLSVTAMIWPTTPAWGRPQALVARFSEAEGRGFSLMLDEAGAVAFCVGAGEGAETVSTGVALRAREWTWVGASFDAESRRAAVFHESLRRYPGLTNQARAEEELSAGIGATGAPLMLAARASQGEGEEALAAAHYNGKIDSPRLAAAALGPEDLRALQDEPLGTAALVAAWDFSRQITTTRILDSGPQGLHGRVVNAPARAMKGWNWSGRELDWQQAPEEYGAIHFHQDDMHDAGWEVDFELVVPERMRSGIYAARLRSEGAEEYVPFYVRPPRGTATASILFLAPTNSYAAYGNFVAPLPRAEFENVQGRLGSVRPQEIFLLLHPEYGRSLYDYHADGSGNFHFSRLQPNLTMRPKCMRLDGGGGSDLRQFSADTHLTDWLEAMGHTFDVATDEDLHSEGIEALRPYNVVITGSHPEYHSTRMWEALKDYTDGGGRLMYVGGNGFYWHIAYHQELPGLIEVRRADGTRDWEAEPGERHHAFTGEFSSLLRSGGRAPQMLTGVGMAAFGFGTGAPYRRTEASFDPRAAFIFEGVGDDEPIGDFALICGAAAGLEIDRAEPALGTPPNALVVATSQGLHSDRFRLSIEELLFNDFETSGSAHDWVRADMVYFETAGGGAVFSTGSISWCAALAHQGYDNNVSRITDNVVRRFAAGERDGTQGD